MLILHAGRENIDKEKYIYDNLKGEAIVLVPNQYTFVAEEQALKHTGRTCLFDIEILSMNRLGLRVMNEQGLEGVSMLGRNGRSMLLSKIIRDNKDKLKFFAKSAGRISFTEMLADFISEFKLQNLSIDDMMKLAKLDDTDPVLADKLTELEDLLREYEKAVEGKYTDGEDFQQRYIDQIGSSRWLKGKSIWVYGYDTVTPMFMEAVLELAGVARDVNFILNRSDYDLDQRIESRFAHMAGENGVPFEVREIGCEYKLSLSETIQTIEASLFKDNSPGCEKAPRDLTIVECANEYYEAESAAAYVKKLLREKNYRMKDISIICNDKEVMQPIVQRVFREYGMDIFIDSTRRITDCAPVCFVVSLVALTRFPYSTENIFTLLKSDFSGFEREDVEKLEIYAGKYKIRNTMWAKPFKYGLEEYGEEEFGKLEAVRTQLAEKLSKLEELAVSCSSVSDWISGFKNHLENEWQLSSRLDEFLKSAEAMGELDEVLKIKGSVTETIEVLDQLAQIMGGDDWDREEVPPILEAGLTCMQIGIIPPSLDGISMGTMIRTRPRPARAVLILGANEGKVPMQPSPEGLFSIDEKNYFKKHEWALGSLDDIRMLEESVAVYRMLSKAQEKLYISYSMTDAEGSSLSPSTIIDSLQELFPGLKIYKDVVSMGFGRHLVSDDKEAMRHLLNHLKDRNLEEMDPLSAALMTYFEQKEPELLARLIAAACDDNSVCDLGKLLASRLYSRSGEFVLSASAYQNYMECPFRFYVDRGLRPNEERPFSSDPRSIGDVYHECMMYIGRRLMDHDERPIEEIVDEALEKMIGKYREGLYESTDEEGYRLSRIREIVAIAGRAMAMQLETGSVIDASFEEKFGKGKRFAPVEFDIDGEKVRIEGTIDRADILEGDKARIIDYKTGSDKLDVDKMRNGYKLQLMIYLMSVTSEKYEPVGIFYFNIAQNEQSADSLNLKKLGELNEKELVDEFKLKGQWINEPGNLEMMPAEALYEKKPKGMTREAFDELQSEVRQRLIEQSTAIVKGEIGISPLKDKYNTLSCRYCKYKAICRYDAASYSGNKARKI